MSKPVFSEVQKFRQWWIWIIIVGLVVVNAWALYQQIVMGEPWGNNPASNEALWMSSALIWGIVMLIFHTKLETRINERGITVHFFPFHFSKHTYKWETIEKVYVSKYRPLLEFGGWGVRIAPGRKKAFTVSGNMGLHILLKDGRTRIIGTKRAEAIAFILKEREEGRL